MTEREEIHMNKEPIGASVVGEESITQKNKPQRGNAIVLIGCILAAVCMWFYVMGIDSPTATETFSSVTIDIINQREGSAENKLSAISGTNNVLEVVLKGRKSQLNNIKTEDIVAYVNVSDVMVAGKGIYTVTVEAPAGTIIEDYYPREISVYMDNRETVSVPVKCRLIDYTLPAGYTIDMATPELSISTVQVSGPASELELVDHVRMTLAPGTVTQSFSGSAPLEAVDKNGNVITSKYLSLSALDATAAFNVYITKYIDLNVKNLMGYFDKNNTAVTIVPDRLQVRGPVELLSDLTSHTVAVIDETKIREDGTYHYQIDLPDGIELVDKSSDGAVSVDVRFNSTILHEMKFANEKIEVLNVPDGKMVEILDSHIVVGVRGYRQEIYSLRASSVAVEIDLSNMSSENGEYYADVQVYLKSGNNEKLYVVGDYSVQIRISDAAEGV